MSSNSTQIFSIISINRTKSTRSMEHPGKRWGHSAVVLNNKMIIFGGRHNQRSLANVFSLDLQSLSWNKIDSYGQTPPARDSHSVLMYNSEMLIFGGSGSGKKLNDLWSFNFEHKKWNKIQYSGSIPSPRDGHCVALINNYYMMVYGGMDESEKDLNNIYLFDLRNNLWIQAEVTGDEPQLRDSQSSTTLNNICYIFGGQGEEEERFNDMFTLTFNISDSSQKCIAIWKREDIKGIKPPSRTSHSSLPYKNQFVIIICGEGNEQTPLNDIWLYDTKGKEYTQLIIDNKDTFEGRLCHSSALINDSIVIYGGMKNAEITLDNLAILCIDNKIKGDCDVNVGISKEEKEKKENLFQNGSMSTENKRLINALNSNKLMFKDTKTDTDDLNEDNAFNFLQIKQESIDNILSFKFMKRLSDIYQWPFLCLSQSIINAYKLNANQISFEITSERHILIIKDNGEGIDSETFESTFSSFYKNDDNSYSYFENDFISKLSMLRLSNSILIISKTNTEINIGLISNNLQITLDTDSLMTPTVSFKFSKKSGKYIQKSSYNIQSLNLILHEVNFLFQTKNDLFAYLDLFEHGTHFFLFDMKRLTKEIFELKFNEEFNDIYYQNNNNSISTSFKCYMKYFNLNYSLYSKFDICIREEKVNIINPLYEIFKREINSIKTKSSEDNNKNLLNIFSLNYTPKNNNEKYDCIVINGNNFKGILFNSNYKKEHNEDDIDDIEDVLIYIDNQLICRLGNIKFGIIKKKSKNNICGYIELTSDNTIYSVLDNRAEIKDQSCYAQFYYKVLKLYNLLKL